MAGRPQEPRFSLSLTPPVDDIAASESDWTTDRLTDPYVGDRLRIRQLEKVQAGVSSHGKPVYEMQEVGRGRKVYVLREEATYVTVTSVGMRRGIPTVWYSIEGSTSSSRRSPGGSLAIRAVLADNAIEPGRRQREVRRLAGSGPSAEIRATMTAEAHSEAERINAFNRHLHAAGDAGRARLMEGDTRYMQDLVPVDDARIAGWSTGAERVPTWVMACLLVINEGVDVASVPDHKTVVEPLPDPNTEGTAPPVSTAGFNELDDDDDGYYTPAIIGGDEDPDFTADPDDFEEAA